MKDNIYPRQTGPLAGRPFSSLPPQCSRESSTSQRGVRFCCACDLRVCVHVGCTVSVSVGKLRANVCVCVYLSLRGARPAETWTRNCILTLRQRGGECCWWRGGGVLAGRGRWPEEEAADGAVEGVGEARAL